jgi:hypothetical protein
MVKSDYDCVGRPSTFSMRQLPEIACEPGGPAETRHSSLFVTVAIGCVWLTSSIAPLPSGDTANFSVKVACLSGWPTLAPCARR